MSVLDNVQQSVVYYKTLLLPFYNYDVIGIPREILWHHIFFNSS